VLRHYLTVGIVLLACVGGARGPVPQDAVKRLSPDDKAWCASLDGTVGEILPGVERCIRATTDGGKLCTDGSQCQGTCNAPATAQLGTVITGTCSARVDRMSCVNLVVQGRASGRVCFD